MITYWDRRNAREEQEQVYGDALVQWIYGTRAGQIASESLLSRRWLSLLYGMYQASKLSGHKVEPFIQDFKIRMEEYEPGPFDSFNDFFIRKFRPSVRPFTQNADALAAFAEARYLAFESIRETQTFPVKGEHLTATALLGSAERARPFTDGPLLLARLCPTDYHRFHYPDSGRTTEHYAIHGLLHSVNPLALRYRSDIFATNERHVSILETEHLGRLAYIEVGALCVGKIVQTHPTNQPFRRGDEKGYFLFGASTVIVLGQKGAWIPSKDLLEQTAKNRETLVLLGEEVGKKALPSSN